MREQRWKSEDHYLQSWASQWKKWIGANAVIHKKAMKCPDNEVILFNLNSQLITWQIIFFLVGWKDTEEND